MTDQSTGKHHIEVDQGLGILMAVCVASTTICLLLVGPAVGYMELSAFKKLVPPFSTPSGRQLKTAGHNSTHLHPASHSNGNMLSTVTISAERSHGSDLEKGRAASNGSDFPFKCMRTTNHEARNQCKSVDMEVATRSFSSR